MKKNEKQLLTTIYYVLLFTESTIKSWEEFNNKNIRVIKFLSKVIHLKNYLLKNYKKGIKELNENQEQRLYEVISGFKKFADDLKNRQLFILEIFTKISSIINSRLTKLCYEYDTFNEDILHKIML